MHVRILQKKTFVENVWPANSALFIYVLTQFVETVKHLDYNGYSQLTRWDRGNAFALGLEFPASIPGSRKAFMFDVFVVVVVVFILLLSKTHYLLQNVAVFWQS